MRQAVLLLLLLSGPAVYGFQRSTGAGIISIAPTFGAAGTTVSIRGKGFNGFEPGSPWVKDLAQEPPPGVVEFNGVAGDVLFWADDLITVKVPRQASSGPIRIVLLEPRTVLTGDAFDVYYSTADQTSPQRSIQEEDSRRFGGKESPTFFDERVPGLPLYANPWFSSLAPGERTLLSENGFWFGSSFSSGRRRGPAFFNQFTSGGFFSQQRGQGFGLDPFSFGVPFFQGFFFRRSHNFGVRPFGFSFDQNPFSSSHNESRNQGHNFRR